MTYFTRFAKADKPKQPNEPSDPLDEEAQDTDPMAQETNSAVAIADAENHVSPGKDTTNQ